MADTTIPGARNAVINFYAQHEPIWADVQADIGLSVEQLAQVKEAVDAAVLARNTAEAARNASKLATAMLNEKAAQLRSIGGAAVATIRAYAETTGDEAIYDKAKVSPPAPPKPVGPPVSPTNFTADPNADGTITLKWKGTVSGNQSFVIERSVDMGPWIMVEGLRKKAWLDTKVPMNVNLIRYRIFGVRGNQYSVNPALTNVNFGTLPPELAAAFRTSTTEAA